MGGVIIYAIVLVILKILCRNLLRYKFWKNLPGVMWRMGQPLSEHLPSFHWLPDPPSTLLLLSCPWEDQSVWTASMGSSTLPLLDGLSQWGAPAGSGEREESEVQGINSSPSLKGVPKLAVSLRESHSRLTSLVLGVFLPRPHLRKLLDLP